MAMFDRTQIYVSIAILALIEIAAVVASAASHWRQAFHAVATHRAQPNTSRRNVPGAVRLPFRRPSRRSLLAASPRGHARRAARAVPEIRQRRLFVRDSADTARSAVDVCLRARTRAARSWQFAV